MISSIRSLPQAVVLSVLASSALVVPLSVAGQELTREALPLEEVAGDFVVGPGKVEVELAPGESRTADVRITNRTGEAKRFQISTEDVRGSRDPSQTVQLLGNQRGPYTLRDYLQPATTTFTIAHGERVTLPVEVSVPPDAEPGGRYGSLLVETVTPPGEGTGTAIVSRIGVLFFVRVPGDVNEQGELVQFTTKNDRQYFASGPIAFELLFDNSGSVHLNPYGRLTIENVLGEVVGEVDIDPWFALPDSLRLREVTWDRPYLIGRYTARAEINRGYGNVVDAADVTFWVIPVKLILGVLAGVALLLLLLRLIASRFEIRRR